MKKLAAILIGLLLLVQIAFCAGVAPEVYVEDGVAITNDDLVEWGYDYLSMEEVSLYLHAFCELPPNYLTKSEARELGWNSWEGNLWDFGQGLCIGGDSFGNREGRLPDAKARAWYECDVNYEGGYRAGERLVFSTDGLIYYTADHYDHFELLFDGWYDADAAYPKQEEACA